VGTKNGWEAKEVEILARNADEVAIRGVEASAQVALTEPDLANTLANPGQTTGSEGAKK
jgi:hypothetical protein